MKWSGDWAATTVDEPGVVTNRGLPGESPDARPVRICFPFGGDLLGGSHISALRLIQSLPAADYHPLVVLHRADGPVADFLCSEAMPFEVIDGPGVIVPEARTLTRLVPHSVRLVNRLTRFLRERQVAIVHTNEGAMHATWALPAMRAGARLLWHHRGNPRATGLRYLAPLVADRVVSVSRFAAPRDGFFSAADRTTVVHSPFDTQAPAPDRAWCRHEVTERMGIAPDTALIGYFGNFVGRKRPLAFVDMIARLRAESSRPVVGAMFGSDGDEGLMAATRARARALGLEGTLRVMGYRRPIEMWMAACDVLAVPAIEEPYGRTLIEAMLLGTPVVATRSGGNSEAIRDGETGLLVPPDDAPAMARAIAALLADPDRAARIAATAQAEARTRYGIDKHCRSIMAVYRSLSGDRP